MRIPCLFKIVNKIVKVKINISSKMGSIAATQAGGSARGATYRASKAAQVS